MDQKFDVYFGCVHEDKQVKLVTFNTLEQAEEFIATVVKAINLNNAYIRKTKQSETSYWYDYGEK